jgi:hypothetical protein
MRRLAILLASVTTLLLSVVLVVQAHRHAPRQPPATVPSVPAQPTQRDVADPQPALHPASEIPPTSKPALPPVFYLPTSKSAPPPDAYLPTSKSAPPPDAYLPTSKSAPPPDAYLPTSKWAPPPVVPQPFRPATPAAPTLPIETPAPAAPPP